MKKLFIVSCLLIFWGCSQKSYLYWKNDFKNKYKTDKKIGINVEVPEYLYSGKLVAKKNNKLILLKTEINQIPDDFFTGYLVDSLSVLAGDYNIKSYPWEFQNNKPQKIYIVKIKDYFIDFDNKKVVLIGKINNKNFNIIKRYKKDYLGAYKKVYDELVLKIFKDIKEEE